MCSKFHSAFPCLTSNVVLPVAVNYIKQRGTTDTQHAPNQIMDFYQWADIIVQDCETSPFKSGVHAHYRDLETLPKDIQKKMILCHYQDDTAKARLEIPFNRFALAGEEYPLNTTFLLI